MSDANVPVPVPVLPVDAEAGEAAGLARKMGDAYRRSMTYRRDEMKQTFADADAEARGLHDGPGWRQNILDESADQVSWWALNHLVEHDEAQAAARWASIKAAARNELASGQHVADVMDHLSTPFQRAQFLAIRTALIEEWQPRGGMELMLIDTLATAQASYFYWLARLHERAEGEVIREDPKLKQAGYWQPPRIEAAAALEQAAAMADRFNRLFLRTLRALRDLRRYSPAVVVQHAGQVNVGAQQINVSRSAEDDDAEDRE